MNHPTAIAILVAAFAAHAILGQDIVFPNDDDDNTYSYYGGGAPVTEAKPIKTPEKCPENMLLYLDEGPKKVGVCDCKPLFVYFPQNDSCHEVFAQGPCPDGQYVYLPVNDSLPRCVPNPCSSHGLVHYKGVCHKLRTIGGPCGDAVLTVNATTFQLECVSADNIPFVIIEAPKRNCPRGSRRDRIGICKIVL